jgi:hypothetical protein
MRVPVPSLEEQWSAYGARIHDLFYREVLPVEAAHEAKLDQFRAQLDLGLDDLERVLRRGRERLLAQDRLPETQALQGQPGVGSARRGDHDGLDAVVPDHLHGIPKNGDVLAGYPRGAVRVHVGDGGQASARDP